MTVTAQRSEPFGVRPAGCALTSRAPTLGGKHVGYARLTRRRHDREPTGKLAHRWWYRCLERAGVVPEGATGGMNMHRGRHTAATELQCAHHDLRLTQLLLGHDDIRSTARYAQLDTADLAEALREIQGAPTKCSNRNRVCGKSGGGGNRTRERFLSRCHGQAAGGA
jgi:Phage integrase family